MWFGSRAREEGWLCIGWVIAKRGQLLVLGPSARPVLGILLGFCSCATSSWLHRTKGTAIFPWCPTGASWWQIQLAITLHGTQWTNSALVPGHLAESYWLEKCCSASQLEASRAFQVALPRVCLSSVHSLLGNIPGMQQAP